MNLGKRLQRIETSLTPKQAVLLWLKGMLELGLVTYLEKSFAASPNEAPRARIGEMIGQALRKSLSQQRMRPELMASVVRDAQKQADALIVLITNLHQYVHLECMFNAPYIVLLYEKFQRLLEQFVHQGRFEPEAWDLWRAVLMNRLITMWQLREAIAVISASYYDGHPLLFAEDESKLNQEIESLVRLMKHYNDLENGIPVWTAISIDARSPSMREQVAAQVAEHVAIAQSTTLEDFGENEAARDLMDPYALRELNRLRSSTSRPDTSTS